MRRRMTRQVFSANLSSSRCDHLFPSGGTCGTATGRRVYRWPARHPNESDNKAGPSEEWSLLRGLRGQRTRLPDARRLIAGGDGEAGSVRTEGKDTGRREGATQFFETRTIIELPEADDEIFGGRGDDGSGGMPRQHRDRRIVGSKFAQHFQGCPIAEAHVTVNSAFNEAAAIRRDAGRAGHAVVRDGVDTLAGIAVPQDDFLHGARRASGRVSGDESGETLALVEPDQIAEALDVFHGERYGFPAARHIRDLHAVSFWWTMATRSPFGLRRT